MRAYHGTIRENIATGAILPPTQTGIIQEEGRKKRLDCVFATPNEGLARVYAGRAARRFGGEPVVVEVSMFDRDITVDEGSRDGAIVLVASGAWSVREV